MRIIRFMPSTSVKSGGPQNGIRFISRLLDENGIKTDIITFDSDLTSIQGIDIIYKYQSFTKYKISLSALISLFSLRKVLSSSDLYIIHGHWQFHVLLAYLASKIFKKNYLIICHGMLDPWFTKNRSISRFFKLLLWNLYEKDVLKNATRICFTTKSELNKSLEIFNSRNNCNMVIPYGLEINSDKYLPNFYGEAKKDNDYLNLVYLGRFALKKNIDSIIIALNNCLQKKLKVKLKLIGLDESNYSYKIIDLIKRLQVEDNVELIKYITNDHKYNLLRDSDFSIISSFQENFCISAIESIALGVPVIISNKCDISEDLYDFGVAITSGTSAISIEKSIFKAKKVKDDNQEYKRMSINSIKTYNEYYSYENTLSHIIDLFKETSTQNNNKKFAN